MPGTTSTALPSFSHDQHYETDAATWKGGGVQFTVDDKNSTSCGGGGEGEGRREGAEGVE